MESGALPLGPADNLPAADVRAEVLGRRFIAAVLDLVVIVVLFLVIAALTGGFHSQTVTNGTGQLHTASVKLSAGPLLAYVVLSLGYYFAAESLTGQTLGKRLMGLQVVTLDGRSPSTGALFVRNLTRIVDALPFLYLLGMLSMLVGTHPRKRIGDRLAGTTVAPV